MSASPKRPFLRRLQAFLPRREWLSAPYRLLHALRQRNRTDRRLALWMLLSLATLLPVVTLLLSGTLAPWDDAQLRLLAGHPFYIGAEEAQVSLLSPRGTFTLCLVLTLWLAAILVRERRCGRRTQLLFLAALATALPGLLCVLWDGVLYTAAPLACLLLLWLYSVPLAALYRLLRPPHHPAPSRS